MPKKVLILTSIYPPDSGGPAIFAENFSAWLSKKGVQNEIISYSLIERQSENISFITIQRFRIVAFLKYILKIIQKSSKDTLIIANGVFVETYIANKFRPIPYVTKVPGDLIWEISKNRGWTQKNIDEFQNESLKIFTWILRKLQNRALQNAKQVIVPSFQLQKLCKIWGVEDPRLSVIFNSVDSNKFFRDDSKQKEFDLITVCRLVPWKGLEELINIVDRSSYSLAIVGDGPLRQKLQSLVTGQKSKIRFFGNLSNSEISNLLNKSRIFVLNSSYEATSYAIIEAKMCGIPVIAQRTDGAAILIRDKVDGLLYSSSIESELSSTLELALNHIDLNTLGENGRKDALIRFNQEINFSKIYEIINT